MNSKNTLDLKACFVPSMTVAPLMAMVVLVCTSLGCATGPRVPLRADGSPGPEKCSDEALKAMRILRLMPETGAFIEIDENQIGKSPVILVDGYIESLMDEELETLPANTRLYGKVWTDGPLVVIRYYEAQPPDSDRVPICGVVRWGPEGVNGRKLSGSRPGVAVLKLSRASMWIVDEFH
ncbi:MAG TPA: serine/threonine protein kinase [Archangium sp.]|jgi:hypothetical protein|uniref:serine/threonine protein kinase n=1 Tax=Archangium sp. TaxID=1872627 RepID=UPI002ED84D8D